MKRLVRLIVVVSGAAGLMGGVLTPATLANAQCVRRYRDLGIPAYDRRVIVEHYHYVSCTEAARVGSAVADAYERGLPIAELPPPPAGVPGGQGRTFTVHTRRYGTYTCRLTARGSDFVEGRCRRGRRFTSFLSLNHYYVHGQ